MKYLKRIAILVPSLENGGMERFSARLSILLESKGIDIFLFLLRYDRTKAYPHSGKVVICPCEMNNKWSYDGFLSYMINSKLIKDEKKKYNIEATISVSPEMNLLNLLSKKNDRIICTIHNCMSLREDVNSFAYSKKVMFFYNLAYRVVTVSKWCRNDLIEEYNIKKENIRIIYNPYDTVSGNKSKIEKPIIVCVGRLEKIKQQWHIIKSFKYVSKYLPDAELWIVGEGPEKKHLIKLSIDMDLKDQIKFMGFVKNIEEIYQKARLSVLASKSESFSYAAVESIVNGVPLVVSDFPGGIREVMGVSDETEKYPIKSNVGYIVKNFVESNSYCPQINDDEIEMGKVMLKVLLDKKEYTKMSKNCKIMAKRFCSKTICEQWIELLIKE